MVLSLLAVVLFETNQFGIDLRVEAETTKIDPAKSICVTLELKVPHDRTATLPDLRDRVVGFSLAEYIDGESVQDKDGSTRQIENWRLVPEPCAADYKIRPFVVKASPKIYQVQVDEGKYSFRSNVIRFDKPAPREPVTGEMEVDPEKDLPPLSWRLVLGALCLVLGAMAVAFAIWLGIRYCFRRVKEHRMSPIERAWVELDRLLQKGLPGRGRYKDFYVELTMVVRRYVQRRYGIKAPHLTTEEFLREFGSEGQRLEVRGRTAELRKFLESADMVKFAGVEATPEMADAATDSARGYLKSDATSK